MKEVDIIIQPLGGASIDRLRWLKLELERRVPIKVNIMINVWRLQPPLSLYNWSRMQYEADKLALWLLKKYQGYTRPLSRLILGIVNSDGFVTGLNFVFGIALPKEGVALVFTKRLEDDNEAVFKLRMLKESLHELGHLFGLSHCLDPSCVMSFSNTILDVDRKKAEYCDRCKSKILSIFHQ